MPRWTILLLLAACADKTDTDVVIDTDALDTDALVDAEFECVTPEEVCDGCSLDIQLTAWSVAGSLRVNGVDVESEADEIFRLITTLNRSRTGIRRSLPVIGGQYEFHAQAGQHELFVDWSVVGEGETEGLVWVADLDLTQDLTVDLDLQSMEIPTTLTVDGEAITGTLSGADGTSQWTAPISATTEVPDRPWTLTLTPELEGVVGSTILGTDWRPDSAGLQQDITTVSVPLDVRLDGTPLTTARQIRYVQDGREATQMLPDGFDSVRFMPGEYTDIKVQLNHGEEGLLGWLKLAETLSPQEGDTLAVDATLATVTGSILYDGAPLPDVSDSWLLFLNPEDSTDSISVELDASETYSVRIPHGLYDLYLRPRNTGAERPTGGDVLLQSGLLIEGDTTVDGDIEISTLSGSFRHDGLILEDVSPSPAYTISLFEAETGRVASGSPSGGPDYAIHVPAGRYRASVYIHPLHAVPTAAGAQVVADEVDLTDDVNLDIDMAVISLEGSVHLNGIALTDGASWSMQMIRYDLPEGVQRGFSTRSSTFPFSVPMYPGLYSIQTNIGPAPDNPDIVQGHWDSHDCIEIR